ncbi:hypothetical protein FAZ78_06605 [Cereibacter changlensis]|jgi:hypothetical protein|uniref:Uncharacterized protein n=2 Tax=Cereibacter changlensis TaxID=402884 RepID=A0A2T4K090_9RHOB|nr:hypothetical protein [Cereibacter changlensis]MBZ4690455.1 hypothetical protein [Cereibacter sp.]PTE23423.1 hypothetical protein C5F48_02205 [Cereibacter changlensis JA139]PZX49727.1 hypothetical protein LX76_03727 [Cereibacter changlensis]TKA97337.1 hypothetical protein FAZ78_06605 [Cereibacter changlensis]
MANADKKHFGAGIKGKSDGTGAMSVADTADIPANAVLSNRDKQGSSERGRDGKSIQTEQYQDHQTNRRSEE